MHRVRKLISTATVTVFTFQKMGHIYKNLTVYSDKEIYISSSKIPNGETAINVNGEVVIGLNNCNPGDMVQIAIETTTTDTNIFLELF